MNTKFLILLIVLCLCTSLFSQLNETGYFSYLKNAYENKNSKTVEYLMEELTLYTETYPESANLNEALYMLGQLYEEDKNYVAAFIVYLKIIFIYPQSSYTPDVISHINQIVQEKAERTFKYQRVKIDEMMTQAVSSTDPIIAYYNCLEFLYNLNIDNINKILDREINSYLHTYNQKVQNVDQSLYWLAQLKEKQKRWPEAILIYTKLNHINSESILIPKSLFRIAFLQYSETKQYDESRDAFINLLTNFAEHESAGDAQFYLAELYEKRLKNKNEAASNYLSLVETYPNNKNTVEALKRVAEIKEDQKDIAASISAYHQIFELYPQDPYAPKALLEIEVLYRRKLKNYEKAIEILKIYADQYAQQKDAAERLYDVGELYEDELKNKQAAIETYHEVINRFPESRYSKRAKNKIEDLSTEEI